MRKHSKYYVTMTDSFMSGWGHARNATNKLVIECDTWEEAETVEANALARSEMKYVNIRTSTPYYGKGYYVSWHSKEDYPSWFKPGYFAKQTEETHNESQAI